MKKHVIYIDSSENLESLIEKIELSLDFKSKIYILVPEESPLFLDKNNFEVFVKKTKEMWKEIVLVSQSSRLFKLANIYKIQFQNTIDNDLILSDSTIKIKKIWERWSEKNPYNEERVKYSLDNFKKKIPNLYSNSYLQEKKEKIAESYSLNKRIIFPLIIWSFALIFTILFLIIPKSQIYIEPSSKVVKYTWNFNFIWEKSYRKEEEKNNILYKNIERLYEDSVSINSNWKSFEWSYADWIVIIKNSFWEDIAFKKWTRLQTSDWLVFKTNYYINIPKAKKIRTSEWEKFKDWEARVSVKAEDLDIYSEVIWDRWNVLKWTEFTIPWLTSYLQKFIKTNAESDFEWWTTKWRKIVTKEDLQIAQEKVKNLLFEKAKIEIQKEIEKINSENLTNYKLFPDERYFKITVSKVETPKNILWEKHESFITTWAVVVNAIYYDDETLSKKLEENIHKKIHPEMKLSEIDWNNVWIRAFETDEASDTIKATVTINWRESYDLFWESDFSKRFLMEVKEKLVNLKKESAEKYLKSLPEISSIEVRLWPPFVDKLPKIENWIEIKEKIND